MGEEAKQESPKAHESKPEENQEEKKEPKPPSPCVLFLDLHCKGCAKKIKKSIMKMRGVEGVVIDMAKNEVTIKGTVEPQAICNMISKKTKKRAKVISPLPEAVEGEPIPSQASEPVIVELNISMHCEACAAQLKRKILKMRGVETAVTELSTGKAIVTGTMDANKLVDYVYRRTKKQVKIVSQPEPEAEPEKKEENKELEKPAAEEAKPDEEEKEEGGKDENENKEEKGVEEVGGDENGVVVLNIDDDESMKRMMYHYYYYQPLCVIEGIPPPQLFSDENPNACCIS
ncbi:hypothetical protein GYH30_010794 [Glycine max]|nr:hypothetical protein GYH30_010794 [Glycine max]